MGEEIIYLEHYPFGQCYDSCHHFIETHIDWHEVNHKIKQDKITYFSVDSCIELFPHLQLDEEYTLVCFVASEYHGIWGRVAAIPQQQLDNIVLEIKKDIFREVKLELPQVAAPPMEAIYCDGTPEGFLEVLLLKQLLAALPYARHERDAFDHFITEKPLQYSARWNEYVDIPDWRPRIIISEIDYVSLIIFTHITENGLGSSSDKDRIYLSRYNFHKDLSATLMLEAIRGKRDQMYHTHIENSKRYCKGKHCCVTGSNSVLIAKEKVEP